jgi:hypothetical protein
VHRGGVGQLQLVQLAEVVADYPSVEVGHQLAGLRIDRFDQPEIAVEHFLGVVVGDLHHLVARAEGPPEPLDPDLARQVQEPLQVEVQRPRTQTAVVHRAQHLEVLDWKGSPSALVVRSSRDGTTR